MVYNDRYYLPYRCDIRYRIVIQLLSRYNMLCNNAWSLYIFTTPLYLSTCYLYRRITTCYKPFICFYNHDVCSIYSFVNYTPLLYCMTPVITCITVATRCDEYASAHYLPRESENGPLAYSERNTNLRRTVH